LHFLMEPLVYHPQLAPGTAEFARAKPELVARAVEVFAAGSFNVGTLKIEVPVDFAFVEGFGEPQMSRTEALAAFRAAAAPAGHLPLVYLSAGVPFDWFEASLKMAREAGVALSGFMCGRSIWWDAIAIFGAKGETAMREWLAETGTSRLRRLIAVMEPGDNAAR
jgi:tagatose 1,6-diphosphate aldolase